MVTNRMLKKSKLAKAFAGFSREFNEYSLLNFTLASSEKAKHPLYWRLISKEGIVEIGLDNPSGILTSIQIKMFSGELKKTENNNLININKQEGIPVFTTDFWNLVGDIYDTRQYYFDVRGQFDVLLETSQLNVSFSPDRIHSVIDMPEKILCGLNKSSELCSLFIYDLSKEEQEQINTYMQDLQRDHSNN
jgi:hypothetical protein